MANVHTRMLWAISTTIACCCILLLVQYRWIKVSYFAALVVFFVFGTGGVLTDWWQNGILAFIQAALLLMICVVISKMLRDNK